MTGMPEGNFVTSLLKLDGSALLALVLAGLTVLILYSWEAWPFAPNAAYPPQLVGGLAVIASWLLIVRTAQVAIARGMQAYATQQAAKVAVPFSKLSEDQRRFLTAPYKSGSRHFQIAAYKDRWFEQLIAYRYVENGHSDFIFIGGPKDFAITEAGWNELQKAEREGRLPTAQWGAS